MEGFLWGGVYGGIYRWIYGEVCMGEAFMGVFFLGGGSMGVCVCVGGEMFNFG